MATSRISSPASDVLLTRGGGTAPPPEVVATWPAPNYINPKERGWGAPIFLTILLLLTLVVYIARIRARLMVKNAGVDDILMSVAILPVIGLTISTILGIKIYGFQRHIWDQTIESSVQYTNITMAIEFCYMAGSTLIKVSILFLYRRLAGSITNMFVYAVWACMAFCIASFVAFFLALFFTCSPMDRTNNCATEGIVLVSATAISTIQDLIISFLPVFLIQNLQMPRRQKLALGGIFGLGVVTTVCGVMRTYYLVFVYYYTYDITWYAYYGWIWTVVESHLGVICASVPALRIYFRNQLESTVSRTSNSRSKNQSGQTKLSDQIHGPYTTKSFQNADIEARKEDIILQNIVVQHEFSSSIQERDDASQMSDSSTRNLATIVHGPLE